MRLKSWWRVCAMSGVALAVLIVGAESARAATIIEGFESGNLSQYTSTGVTNATVAGEYAHDGSFGLGIDEGGWIYRDDAAAQLAQGDTFSVWIQFDDIANGRAYFGFGSSAAGTLSFVLAPNTGDIRFQENPVFGFTELDSTPTAFLADTWYLAEVIWGFGGNLTGNLYGSDGSTLISSVSATSNLFTSGGIAFRGFAGIKAFDTVTLQSAPEPTTILLLGMAGAFWGFRGRRAS